VLGPRDHSTRRMASSASVGFLRSVTPGIVYDSLRSCQYETVRSHNICDLCDLSGQGWVIFAAVFALK
jgi:hypothetical protein